MKHSQHEDSEQSHNDNQLMQTTLSNCTPGVTICTGLVTVYRQLF